LGNWTNLIMNSLAQRRRMSIAIALNSLREHSKLSESQNDARTFVGLAGFQAFLKREIRRRAE